MVSQLIAHSFNRYLLRACSVPGMKPIPVSSQTLVSQDLLSLEYLESGIIFE